jgi:pimeloyl-ACP methyl ester carboxylesterase
MQPLRLLSAVFIPLLLAFAGHAQEPGVSTWGGWAAAAGSSSWIQVRFSEAGCGLDDFGAGQFRCELRDVTLDGNHVEFVHSAPVGAVTFRGERSGGRIDGSLLLEGEEVGRFHLTRFVEDPESSSAHLGSFDMDDGGRIWVLPSSRGGLKILVRDHDEWSYESFLPWEKGSYFARTTKAPCLPPEEFLRFGDSDHMIWTTAERMRTAIRTDALRVRPVRFESGDLELHGMLLLPPGKGPFPTVVMAHGSGPVTASHTFDLYYALRIGEALGLAVLRWDKRGAGRSDGDWESATYRDLADDVSAAFRFASRQPEVDPARVGLGGVSQAPSWVLPMVAAEEEGVAFVIGLSGQVGTIVEADLFNLSNKLRLAGFSETDVEEAVGFIGGAMEFMKKPARQTEYDVYVDAHRDRPWFEAVDRFAILDTPLDAPPIAQWRAIRSTDSSIMWPEVRCPVFLAFGENDVLADVKTSVGRLEAMMGANSQLHFTIRSYPDAGHDVGVESAPTLFHDMATWWHEPQWRDEPRR